MYICTPDGPGASKIWVPRFALAPGLGVTGRSLVAPEDAAFFQNYQILGGLPFLPQRASYAPVVIGSLHVAPLLEDSPKGKKKKKWSHQG